MLKRFAGLVLPVALLLLFASGCKPTAAKGVAGLWQGTLKVQGTELRIVFHVNQAADGKLSATLDSPDQGATGIAVDECSFGNGKLTLAVKSIAGGFEGMLKNDSTIEGKWNQGGMSLPLVLKRIEKVAAALRPQEPKRPYPYKDEEVTLENQTAGITLAGTLTLPETGGPFAAAVLITGSGPQSRDEEVFGHKPFLVLSDYLTRQGIAVLRCDDRGVGKSGGDSKAATTADFATDALAAFEYLRTRKEIDPKRIGLIGHSEGGVIAPMVANLAPDVAYVVLMAGTGIPGDSVLMLQSRLVAKAEGASESTLAKSAVAQRALLDLAKSNLDSAGRAARLKPLLKEAISQLSPADSHAINSSDTSNQAVEQQIKAVLTPWFHYFLNYDPRPALTKLRQPVLAIVGEKDVQVAPKENLAAIDAALKAGGNKDYLTKELPGLNHLFQTATTGGVSEYAKIEETISPTALKVMGDWILARVRTQK
ncbi:alpha/beta hydrolase [candidate division WOR-3 bacterium]|uniref:Alpha/beta hydrolase n=1 Tax=candidate division WOR-3 bacterium TaxID=2052148 RepID=A0A937XI90_UNCW3|nr:alpha/beta hydrolase [candidate division WOR-3 bacterium]